MADKSTQLILDAFRRAAVEPAGLPLHGGKASPSLFPNTAAARQTAQRCKDEGHLRVVRTEARGKTAREICTLTEKGLAYLLSQVSSRPVLEDLVRAVESRQAQLAELLALSSRMQADLDALKTLAWKAVQQPTAPVNGIGPASAANGAGDWTAAALSYLTQRQESNPAEDCPLPELYRQVQQTASHLSIGQFHDGLRKLQADGQIYLHPWTGPLYDLPEPPCALLVGHEIAYYASLRQG